MTTTTFAVTCVCGTQLRVSAPYAGQTARCPVCQRIVAIPYGPSAAPTVIEATAVSRTTYAEGRPDPELRSYLIIVVFGLCCFALFGRDWLEVDDERRLVTADGNETTGASTPHKLLLKTSPVIDVSLVSEEHNKSDLPSVDVPRSASSETDGIFGESRWTSTKDEEQRAAVAALPKVPNEDAMKASPGSASDMVAGRDIAAAPENKPVDMEAAYDGPTAANISEALKLSRRLGKPILLFFFADSCSWCRKMKSQTLTDKHVQSAMRKYVFVTIDANDQANANLKSKYAVKGIPAYVITDRDGKLIKSGAGFQPDAREFAYWLDDSNVWKRVNAAKSGRN